MINLLATEAEKHRASDGKRRQYEFNPLVASRLLWATSLTHSHSLSTPLRDEQGNEIPCPELWDQETACLDPISVEEKKVCIEAYNKVMDPEATVGACSSCGVWIVQEKNIPLHKRLLKDLNNLELSDVSKQKYIAVPNIYRRVRGVTTTTDGKYYGLYRPYLSVPIDDHIDCTPDGPVDPDTTYAYLCNSCFKFTRSGNQDKSPPMSLVTGVDYGLAHIHMPELSFIEKLLLCTSQPYGHMFMLGGKSRGGQVGIKGHMVTMKTNTGNITASIALQHERVSLPRTEFHMQFMYVGNMDKWNSIKNTDNGRVEFIQLFTQMRLSWRKN
jgi:hypothetical protein